MRERFALIFQASKCPPLCLQAPLELCDVETVQPSGWRPFWFLFNSFKGAHGVLYRSTGRSRRYCFSCWCPFAFQLLEIRLWSQFGKNLSRNDLTKWVCDVPGKLEWFRGKTSEILSLPYFEHVEHFKNLELRNMKSFKTQDQLTCLQAKQKSRIQQGRKSGTVEVVN